jgi:hypothetical protein
MRQHTKMVMNKAARLSFCTQAVSQAGSRGSNWSRLADAGGSEEADGTWREALEGSSHPRGAGLLAAAALQQPTTTTTTTTRTPPRDNTDDGHDELPGCVFTATSTKRIWDTDTQVNGPLYAWGSGRTEGV